MDNEQLEIDANGNIALKPLTGYRIKSLAGVALALILDYEERIGNGEVITGSIQLSLLPNAALDLAESLRRSATGLLSNTATGNARTN
jgi:hypothetical protein